MLRCARMHMLCRAQPTTPPAHPRPPACLQVHFAQEIVLVGDSPALGAWQLSSAAAMTWGEGDVWSATVSLPAGADVAFKFVVTDPKR